MGGSDQNSHGMTRFVRSTKIEKPRNHENEKYAATLEDAPYLSVFRLKHPDRKQRMTPARQENTKMKINELKENEMEQVCGGNFFADLEDVLRKIFTEPSKPANPGFPQMPEDCIGRGKC